MEAKELYPKISQLLTDPSSMIHFSGMNVTVKGCSPPALAFVELLLENDGRSDLECVDLVLAAAASHQIGNEDSESWTDLALFSRFAMVHKAEIPHTCLALMSYGHSKAYTHPAVSQSIYDLYYSLIHSVPASPMVAKAAVEFAVVEYDLNAWKDPYSKELLRLICEANRIMRACEHDGAEPLLEDQARLDELVTEYWSKRGDDPFQQVRDNIWQVTNKLFTPTGKRSFQDAVSEIDPLIDLLRDQAHRLWPFMNSAYETFGEFSRLLDLIDENKDGLNYQGKVFDSEQICLIALKALASNPSVATEKLSRKTFNSRIELEAAICRFTNELDKHDFAPSLKEAALSNLLCGMTNWIGARDKSKEETITYDRQKAILEPLFTSDRFSNVQPSLNVNGKEVMARFVMTEHRQLARHLSRHQRGRHLEDELGF